VHESEEGKLVAQLIKEYLDFYRMEYTLSVYLPEAALQNQESLSRDELSRRSGVQNTRDTPLLVQMLKQLKLSDSKQAKPEKPAVHEEKKGTNKNIFY
jgi:hypothetical protein